MVGTTISALRLWPQTRLALSEAPLWGLCPWSTVLIWLGMGLWLTYAVLVDDALALCSATGIAMQSAVLVHRLPPRRTRASVAGGRLGPRVAEIIAPVSRRFPRRGDFELAA